MPGGSTWSSLSGRTFVIHAYLLGARTHGSSQEPPPEKKATPKPVKTNKQYGGPGMFVPSGENSRHPPRSTSLSGSYGPQPDLYVAPYEQHTQQNPVDNLAQEFNEFSVGQHRRESFPVGSSFPVHRYTNLIGMLACICCI